MDRRLKCLVVDDEPIARRGIKSFVDKVDFLEFEGFAKDIKQAIELLNDLEIDLLFLDIEMPGISGIDFVKTYEEKLPMIIFITAYQDFAVESYDLRAVDYLLKPVSFERFLDSANRALSQHLNSAPEPQNRDSFFIRYEGRHQKVVSQEVVYLSAMQNYTRIHMMDGTQMIVHYTLKSFLERLHPEQFIAVHKSYIVNLDFVDSVSSNTMVLKHYGQIPIGRAFRSEVLPKLLK